MKVLDIRRRMKPSWVLFLFETIKSIGILHSAFGWLYRELKGTHQKKSQWNFTALFFRSKYIYISEPTHTIVQPSNRTRLKLVENHQYKILRWLRTEFKAWMYWTIWMVLLYRHWRISPSSPPPHSVEYTWSKYKIIWIKIQSLFRPLYTSR